LSLVDKFVELNTFGRAENTSRQAEDTSLVDEEESVEETMVYSVTEKDMEFVIPTVNMILRHLCPSSADELPYNIYSKEPTPLSRAYLDSDTEESGTYLIKQFLIKEKLMGMDACGSQDPKAVSGPQELLAKLKGSKSVTIRRTSCKSTNATSNTTESKRKQVVKKQVKVVDGLSSRRNTCQAIMKPDCSKTDTRKAEGMRKAILDILVDSGMEQTKKAEELNLVYLNQKTIAQAIRTKASVVTIEFAGVKFKVTGNSWGSYMDFVHSYINRMLQQLLNVRSLYIVEEKYSFTPDEMKGATRQNREQKGNQTGHLKDGEDFRSSQFDRKTITSSIGKAVTSTYLAENLNKLRIEGNRELKIVVDSELHHKQCSQSCEGPCQCPFCTPVERVFSNTGIQEEVTLLKEIRQRYVYFYTLTL
jgi:hypothetical protein